MALEAAVNKNAVPEAPKNPDQRKGETIDAMHRYVDSKADALKQNILTRVKEPDGPQKMLDSMRQWEEQNCPQLDVKKQYYAKMHSILSMMDPRGQNQGVQQLKQLVEARQQEVDAQLRAEEQKYQKELDGLRRQYQNNGNKLEPNIRGLRGNVDDPALVQWEGLSPRERGDALEQRTRDVLVPLAQSLATGTWKQMLDADMRKGPNTVEARLQTLDRLTSELKKANPRLGPSAGPDVVAAARAVINTVLSQYRRARQEVLVRKQERGAERKQVANKINEQDFRQWVAAQHPEYSSLALYLRRPPAGQGWKNGPMLAQK